MADQIPIPTPTTLGLLDKLKLLFKVRQPLTDIISEAKTVKTGWKTWQFWASVAGSLGGLAAALQGIIPLETSLIVTTAITFLYNILRGATKADTVGVKPLLQSSEFWLSLLGYAQNALLALQTGGIDPKWVMESSAFITAGLGMAQNLAAQQPGDGTNQTPPTK